MNYLLLITLFLLVVVLIICIILKTKQFNKLKRIKIEEFSAETTAKCERAKRQEEERFADFQKLIDSKIEKLQTVLSEKEARYEEVNQDLDLYREGKIKEINEAAAEYEQRKMLENEQIIEKHNSYLRKESAKMHEQLLQSEEALKEKITEIKAELEIERSKRAAINEEILRRKKLEEQEDFYKIKLPQDELMDIEILRATAPRLRRPEAINKVIWSNYYQKPLAELRKRLLPNGDFSGVYKITSLKTGEIYIGQTTSMDKRFQDHVKTALGVGTLASSQLHRTMALDGPENFTFEVIEKVPKDKLKERESYYIDFYDSKNYGLNSIRGEQK